VHELDGPDVEAAGGLAGDQYLVLATKLPGQDDLLLVAAGQRAPAVAADPVRDVELGDALRRVFLISGRLRRRRRRTASVVHVEDEILGDRE